MIRIPFLGTASDGVKWKCQLLPRLRPPVCALSAACFHRRPARPRAAFWGVTVTCSERGVTVPCRLGFIQLPPPCLVPDEPDARPLLLAQRSCHLGRAASGDGPQNQKLACQGQKGRASLTRHQDETKGCQVLPSHLSLVGTEDGNAGKMKLQTVPGPRMCGNPGPGAGRPSTPSSCPVSTLPQVSSRPCGARGLPSETALGLQLANRLANTYSLPLSHPSFRHPSSLLCPFLKMGVGKASPAEMLKSTEA